MIVGITGSVGTGKSTVSRMFEKKGAVRIDADALAHEAVEKGKAPYRLVIRFFGKEILRKDGFIERKKLAKIVFKNRKKLKALNGMVHPYVIRRIKEEIRRLSRRRKNGCIVVEVPLLHESRLMEMFDHIITVSCRSAVQKERWLKRGWKLKELKERGASQLPLSYKKEHSDFIIDNSERIQDTKVQVSHIWEVINHGQRKEKKWQNKK